MSQLVQPRLINDPFSDPGVFADFRFGRRALLFDLGEVAALSARELMRVSDVLVSHAHMDHLAGFDRLLRVCLHRPRPLRLVGPDGFITGIAHRLHSYSWNLLGAHSPDFRLRVAEFADARLRAAAEFRAQEQFRQQWIEPPDLGRGLVLAEEDFRIEAAVLDHGIPSLAFALVEPVRVNVWQGALERLGLVPGPWLAEAKRAVRRSLPPDTPVPVGEGRTLPLGELAVQAFRVGPGQKVAYVTDAADTVDNAARILALAEKADTLFIEAVFLDADRVVADRTRHLTAARAGALAREAGVRHAVPFHIHTLRVLTLSKLLALEWTEPQSRPKPR
ncbi:ribonuclease Z [Methylobacterium oxalidis]|uniref:Ribonuclease Z n=1 Tax=Methylobacterium oxalidis TaxID=944322 RepID=A0A512JDK4_9HYPH|nr:MBL fold metallo-hydrolase [Methylobacterium oxalidis]GEP08021.1 ribonuclease Z [Methylobacterium oxalidis]